MRGARRLRCGLALSVACGGRPVDPGCAEDTAAQFLCEAAPLDVGTWTTQHEPFPDGLLPLVRGPQGLQHVTVGLRWDHGPDLGIGRATVRIRAWDVSAQTAAAPRYDGGLGFRLDGEVAEIGNVFFVVEDPASALGQRWRLHVEVQPVGGAGRATGPWRGVAEGEVLWAEEVTAQDARLPAPPPFATP